MLFSACDYVVGNAWYGKIELIHDACKSLFNAARQELGRFETTFIWVPPVWTRSYGGIAAAFIYSCRAPSATQMLSLKCLGEIFSWSSSSRYLFSAILFSFSITRWFLSHSSPCVLRHICCKIITILQIIRLGQSTICLELILTREWKEWQWCSHYPRHVLLLSSQLDLTCVELCPPVLDCKLQTLLMQWNCKALICEFLVTHIREAWIDMDSMIFVHKVLSQVS